MSVNLGVLLSHKFHIRRPILSFFVFFFVFHLVEVTGEGWSSTSLIRNVSARLRSSNHMLPTDFSQSRAHPRVTYRRIFPLLLLLSAATALLEKGVVRFYPYAAVSIFRNSNKNIADVTLRRNDGIQYRKRETRKICNRSSSSLVKI